MFICFVLNFRLVGFLMRIMLQGSHVHNGILGNQTTAKHVHKHVLSVPKRPC